MKQARSMVVAAIKRETVDSKAFRLQGGVRWLTATVAHVKGDHGEYVVDRLNGGWRCNCRWGANRTAYQKPCSHVLAAALSAAPAAQAVVASQPTVSGVPIVQRQIAEQSTGSCTCAAVGNSDVYFNRHQGTLIHRTCGSPWSGHRKSPIRITPTVGAGAELVPCLA